MSEDRGLPIIRACQAARLSRAAYYWAGMDQAVRDAELITTLQAIVVEEQPWGFWKCRDRLRAQGYGWIHKESGGDRSAVAQPPQSYQTPIPQRVRQSLLVEPRMHAVWAIDFMRDTL
jgi:putative transposase